jgi:hypothetical protein
VQEEIKPPHWGGKLLKNKYVFENQFEFSPKKTAAKLFIE